jgi:hypothetical protein
MPAMANHPAVGTILGILPVPIHLLAQAKSNLVYLGQELTYSDTDLQQYTITIILHL